MNASTVVLVKRHKLEQDAATGIQVTKLLLHPAPTCTTRLAPTLYLHSYSGPLACQSMLVPGPPDLQQLVLVVFLLSSTSANTLLQSGWLPSATCTGGLVNRNTGAYTACADCNLQCVVVI